MKLCFAERRFHIRYFGGKSKIAKDISTYINGLLEEDNYCNTSEAKAGYQSRFQNGLTPHTHTHTHTHTHITPNLSVVVVM